MSPAYNIRLHVAYMSKCSKLNCPKLKPPWLKSQLKSPRRKSFRLKLPQQNGVKKNWPHDKAYCEAYDKAHDKAYHKFHTIQILISQFAHVIC